MDTKKKNPSNKKEEAQLKLESKKQEVLPGQQIVKPLKKMSGRLLKS